MACPSHFVTGKFVNTWNKLRQNVAIHCPCCRLVCNQLAVLCFVSAAVPTSKHSLLTSKQFFVLVVLFSQSGIHAQRSCTVVETTVSFRVSSDNHWSVRTYWGNPVNCKLQVVDPKQMTVYGSSECKSLI